MAHTSIRIEPLSAENYDTWRIQAEALLIRNGTWTHVSGKTPKPVIDETTSTETRATIESKIDKWEVQDGLAKSDLILSIGTSQLKHIRNCTTSYEVWKKLKSIYASQGPTRKATLLEQLLSERLREGDDVRDYLSRFMAIVDKLHQMDIDINDELLTIMLLHSLPSSYDNFCCAIKSHDSS